jgi:hypothetical protein
MQFMGDRSFVCCLARVLNVVAKMILKALNAGSHRDSRKLIYEMAKKRMGSFTDNPRSSIARPRLVIWLLVSEQHMLRHREYSDIGLDYDVDT